MENHAPKLPRWEKLSLLISDVVTSEGFRDELQAATIIQKLDILVNQYGFTDDEISMLDEDLKMLSEMSSSLAFRWY